MIEAVAAVAKTAVTEAVKESAQSSAVKEVISAAKDVSSKGQDLAQNRLSKLESEAKQSCPEDYKTNDVAQDRLSKLEEEAKQSAPEDYEKRDVTQDRLDRLEEESTRAEKGNEKSDVVDVQETRQEYLDDVCRRSEVPETIDKEAHTKENWEKQSPEQTAEMREEFDDKKADLKKEWEAVHGKPWPKYEEDVYSDNGKLIRKKGSDYDAHHIQPLSMGGKNEVGNITPLHAKEHYDKQGVHAPNSPYDRLDKTLGGKG